MAKIKTSSAKAKGRRWQQECGKFITEVFKLEEGDIESRPMGSGGTDLMMSPAAKRAFPFSLECKKTTAPFGKPAMEQARHNALKGTIGAVAWQPRGVGGSSGIISFDFEEFVKWYASLDVFENRVRNTCGNCLGRGIAPGKAEMDDYGCMRSYDETCSKCKGSGKNERN